ncbi:hypothetical protein H2203_000955 [Taxawa tesnikishii (nom. ined.)]|nr:hypothetical protein H2203_000955 [Dothideales sp. JES 119]
MRQYTNILSFALAATATATSLADRTEGTHYGVLLPRQDSFEEAYIAQMCTPNSTSPVPPCQAIIDIEEACQPNGTAPLDYLAHQQCMCNGGFFSNWNGCLNCQYVHGSRSEAVVQAFESIISSASVQLCTGTPTASFAAIFSAVSEAAPQTATGAATVTSDRYPGNSAVSLYYTATGPQGAGAITGSSAARATVSGSASSAADAGSSGSSLAASATATATASTSAASSKSGSGGSSTSSGSSSGSGSGSSTASAASTSASSSSGAGRVNVVGGLAALTVGGLVTILCV